MTRSKCLAMRWRSFTRPTRTPMAAAPLSEPRATAAAMRAGAASVASRRPSRLRAPPPARAADLAQAGDARAGEQAPIAPEAHLRQPEHIAQFLELGLQGGRVG